MSLSLQTFAGKEHLMLAATARSFVIWPIFGLEEYMKGLAIAGVVLLVLGILSFVVPFPSYHHHGATIGDAHIGVTTEHDQKIPPVLSVVLVVAGAGLLITGRKG
jgi:preprotein translocase subunit Sss1